MLRIGLTGGIGAGKSTVAARLAAHGAVVVDADRLARQVLAPGSEGLAEVVARFGPQVLAPGGSLDRAALGAVVFADAAAREQLNAITHPRIAELTTLAIAEAGPEAVVVHDVPLLVENRMGSRYHLVLVVHAPTAERVRRLTTERGMSADDAWARVRAQADDEARRASADVWLDNTGAAEDLLAAVDRLWVQRLSPFEQHLRAGEVAPRPDVDVIVQPDPTWPAQAARLAARIEAATGPLLVWIDHVGPTAIAQQPARDVIDLRLVVGDLAEAGAVATLQAALARAGYIRCPDEGSDGAPGADRGPELLFGSCDPGRAVDLHVRDRRSPEAHG